MFRASLAVVIAVTIAGFGCGGSQGPATNDSQAIAKSKSSDPGQSTVTSQRRSPSSALTAGWPFGPDVSIATYVDVEGLRKTPNGPALLDLISTFQPDGPNATGRCLSDTFQRTSELAVGHDRAGTLALLRLADATTEADLSAVRDCLQALSPGTSLEVKGRVLAVGPASLVQGKGGIAAPRSMALELGADEYVVMRTQLELGKLVGSLRTTRRSTQFLLTLDATDEALARDVEQALDLRTPTREVAPDEAKMRSALATAFVVKRDGKHVQVTFTSEGSAAEQARTLATAGAYGVYNVRRYLARAKGIEARNVLAELARRYSDSWQRGTKRALTSFPVIPKQIPSGKKAQTTRDEWKPWSPLEFWMDQPQYFQYEIVAAKDGKSLEIVARGDLDGDGKPSLFRLRGRLDAQKRLTFDERIEETDPEE